MNTMNMKRILLCLLIGISYLFANAQGVVVYKKDGTKIKVPYEQLDSISTYGAGDEPIDEVSLIGVWKYNFGTNDYVLLTFRQDGTVRYQEYDGGKWQTDATYTYVYNGNILKIINNSGSEMGSITVIRLTATELVLKDWPDGGENIFIRQNSDEPEPVQHEWVDLDLPSRTLWATMNVGASKPEEYGDYFAWGETQPKSDYNWGTYKYCNGSSSTMTKYCTNASYGTVDNKTELEPEDDAATANWGEGWIMPTLYQYNELINSNYTTTEWTTVNGVNGRKITSKSNGNSIFLPASGGRSESSLVYTGSYGSVWSRSLNTSNSLRGYDLYFDSSGFYTDSGNRYYGRSVRPVRGVYTR